MPNGEKKGITVRIDADLHAEVSQYLRDHSMTMAEFVSLALDDELHPKNQMKEGNTMANTRTIAVQVPEDLFQRIKDYLQRNNMTQRQFLIGLIEDELERDQTERESQNETVSDDPNQDEDDPEQNEDAALDDSEADSDEDEDESEDEAQGFTIPECKRTARPGERRLRSKHRCGSSDRSSRTWMRGCKIPAGKDVPSWRGCSEKH